MLEGNMRFDALISVGAALAALCSVVYNWVYFATVGFGENEIITLSDIAASSIGWIPPLAASFGIGAFISVMGMPPDRHLAPGATRSDYFHIGMALLVALSVGLFSPSSAWPIVVFAMMFVWIIVFPLLDLRPIIFRFGEKVVLIVFSLPVMFAFAVAAGGNAAAAAMNDVTYGSEIVFRGNQKELKVVVFRYLDRGVLYRRSSDARLVFSLWEEIAEVRKGATQLDARPRTCSWLNLGCPASQPSSSSQVKKP
jgi:hypothetical protein